MASDSDDAVPDFPSVRADRHAQHASAAGVSRLNGFRQAADFGIRCDGVTDDTSALQKALNRLLPHDALKLPAGTCITSSEIRLRGKHNVAIFGAGMSGHVCPYGLKSRHLLRSRGYDVDDRWLRTRAETDAFKAEHDVKMMVGDERSTIDLPAFRFIRFDKRGQSIEPIPFRRAF